MSDTPRTDNSEPTIDTHRGGWVRADFARDLERELSQEKARLDWVLSADDDQLNALEDWSRESIDEAIEQERRRK